MMNSYCICLSGKWNNLNNDILEIKIGGKAKTNEEYQKVHMTIKIDKQLSLRKKKKKKKYSTRDYKDFRPQIWF